MLCWFFPWQFVYPGWPHYSSVASISSTFTFLLTKKKKKRMKEWHETVKPASKQWMIAGDGVKAPLHQGAVLVNCSVLWWSKASRPGNKTPGRTTVLWTIPQDTDGSHGERRWWNLWFIYESQTWHLRDECIWGTSGVCQFWEGKDVVLQGSKMSFSLIWIMNYCW